MRMKSFKNKIYIYIILTPGAYKGGGGGGCHSSSKIFIEFFRDELLSRPTVFNSCVHIPKTHFDTGLLRISCYGNEI